MLIGLSMSQCVRDIAAGDVPINEVAYIISAAYPDRDGKKLDAMFERYEGEGGVWHDLPAARGIFAMLYNANRIIFPRNTVQGDGTSVLNIAKGHWLNGEQCQDVEEFFSHIVWEADDQSLVNANIMSYVAEHSKRWYVELYDTGEVHMFRGTIAEHGAYNSVITEDGVRRRSIPHHSREAAADRLQAYLATSFI